MPDKIKFHDQLSDEIEQKMSSGFIAYENSHGIDVNYGYRQKMGQNQI